MVKPRKYRFWMDVICSDIKRKMGANVVSGKNVERGIFTEKYQSRG